MSDGIVSDPATEATVRGLRAATRPTDEPGRLRLIAADTTKRKRRARPQGATLFRNPLIQRAVLRVVHRQHVMNTYAANVPGPPVPLYFAGAPLLELFPVVPILGNVSLGVGALSYAGQFSITAVADRDLCPDLEVFVKGMGSSLDALAASMLACSASGEG